MECAAASLLDCAGELTPEEENGGREEGVEGASVEVEEFPEEAFPLDSESELTALEASLLETADGVELCIPSLDFSGILFLSYQPILVSTVLPGSTSNPVATL